MVFQNYGLYPYLPGNGNLAFGLQRRKVPEVRRAVTATAVGITHDQVEAMTRGDRSAVDAAHLHLCNADTGRACRP